jgi:beta-lactamase class A
MTSMVDGVRRGTLGAGMVPTAFSSRPKPAAPVKKINAHSSRANLGVRYITGMDGIRRQAPMSPRDVLENIQGAAVMQSVANATPLPRLRIPKISMRLTIAGVSIIVISVVAAQAFLIPGLTTSKASASASATRPSDTPPAPKRAAPAATVENQQQLNQILANFVASDPDDWGIVVKDLKTGVSATYDPTKQEESASLYKLFVADHIYQRIDLGQLSLSAQAGNETGMTIGGCLQAMITVSSNPCGIALGDILGWGDQNQSLLAEGYKETDLATPQQTDPQDVATLFEKLYDGTLVSASSSQAFLGLLKDQQVNNRLPQGLPAGTVFAHKTGDLDNYEHDAGIVYGPKTNYLVVVMSGPWDEPGNAPAMFANLSSQLWNYFEQ